jgi:DNA replication protein DnaC
MTGPAGSGKTSTAICILDGIGGGCEYRTIERIISIIMDRSRIQQPVGPYWDSWHGRSCTVVDEIGSRTEVKNLEYETLIRAIDERIGKPAIYISNCKVQDLARIYDDRIASRLASGTIIVFPDYDMRVRR